MRWAIVSLFSFFEGWTAWSEILYTYIFITH
jgi:hypothetical protein